MQAVQDCTEIGECRSRSYGSADGESWASYRIDQPRGEPTNSPIRKLAVNVLSPRELRSSTDTQALCVKWVERVINPDDLRTMGIMF